MTIATIEREKIAARLREKSSLYFPEVRAQIVGFRLRQIRWSAYSRLYIFQGVNEAGCRVARAAVKVFTRGAGSLKIAQSQYNRLLELWPYFGGSQRFGIPRPLDLIPDIPALVMEEVSGRSVQGIIKSTFWSQQAFNASLSACRSCGEWLRYFHASTQVVSGDLNAIEKYESLQSGLTQLTEIGFSENLCKDLDLKFKALVDVLTGKCEKRALVHGDFTADNVLMGNKKIMVLDMDGYYTNWIYHDIASFLNSISLCALVWPLRNSVIVACGREFLMGYFGTETYNGIALWFLRASGLVAVALEVMSRRAHQPVLRSYLRHSFTRLFNVLVLQAPVETRRLAVT